MYNQIIARSLYNNKNHNLSIRSRNWEGTETLL